MLQISLLFHWIVLLLQAKKTCFMKEFFIHHVFEIIIIVIAYAKKIYDTIITWKQDGFKSTRTNLLLLFLMTVIVILLYASKM